MKTVKLGDACELIARGVSPKYTNDSTKGVTVLNQRCIRDQKICFELSRLHDLSAKSVKADKFVQLGDILVNSTGQGTLGRSALFEENNRVTLADSHITIIRPLQGKFEPKYFAYLISRCEDDLVDMATGTSGQTELPRALLNSYIISYEESQDKQKKIIERLDGAFERVDRAVELTQKNLQNYQKLFGSTLASSLTSIEGEEVQLGDFITLSYGKGLEKDRRSLNGMFNVYGANGIKTKTDSFLCEQPSIIIGRKGSAGEVNYTDGPFWPLDVTYYVEHDPDRTNLSFIYYLLKTLNLPSLAKGVKPGINRNDVYSITAKLPSLDNQEKMVEKLDKISDQTKQLSKLYEEKIRKLKQLKQSILEEAFRFDDEV